MAAVDGVKETRYPKREKNSAIIKRIGVHDIYQLGGCHFYRKTFCIPHKKIRLFTEKYTIFLLLTVYYTVRIVTLYKRPNSAKTGISRLFWVGESPAWLVRLKFNVFNHGLLQAPWSPGARGGYSPPLFCWDKAEFSHTSV